MIYTEFLENGVRAMIRRNADMAFIPLDIENTDYQTFLRLCAELGEENILEAAE